MNLNHPVVKQMAQIISDCIGCAYSDMLTQIDEGYLTEQLIYFGYPESRGILFCKIADGRVRISRQADVLKKGDYFGYIMRSDGKFLYGSAVYDLELLRQSLLELYDFSECGKIAPVLLLFDQLEQFGKMSFAASPRYVLSDITQTRVFTKSSGPMDEMTYWVTRLATLQKIEQLARDVNYYQISSQIVMCKDNIRYIYQIVLLFAQLQQSYLSTLSKKIALQFQYVEELCKLGSFYYISENMQCLMVGIVNYIIVTIRGLLQKQQPQILYFEARDFDNRLQQVKQLNFEAYKQFKNLKQKYGIDVSETSVFGQFDRFEQDLEKVAYIISSYADFAYLSKTTVEYVAGVRGKLEALFYKIKTADPFDDQTFQACFSDYEMGIQQIEIQILEFVRKTDAYTLDRYIVVMNQLLPVLNREYFKSLCLEKYKLMLSLFYLEVKDARQRLDSIEQNPNVLSSSREIAIIRQARNLVSRLDQRFDYFRRVYCEVRFDSYFEYEYVISQLTAEFGGYYRDKLAGMQQNYLPILFYFKTGCKIDSLLYQVKTRAYTLIYKNYDAICAQAEQLKRFLVRPLLVDQQGVISCNYSDEVTKYFTNAMQLQYFFPLPGVLSQLLITFPEISQAKDILTQFCAYLRALRVRSHFRQLMKPLLTRLRRKTDLCISSTSWSSINLLSACYALQSFLASLVLLNERLNAVDEQIAYQLQQIRNFRLIATDSSRQFLFTTDASYRESNVALNFYLHQYFCEFLYERPTPTLQQFLDQAKENLGRNVGQVIQFYLLVIKGAIDAVELVLSHYFADKHSYQAEEIDTAYLLGALQYFAPTAEVSERLSQLSENGYKIAVCVAELLDHYRDLTYDSIAELFIDTGKRFSSYLGFSLEQCVMAQIAAVTQGPEERYNIPAPLFSLEVVFNGAEFRLAPDVNQIDAAMSQLIGQLLASLQRIPLWNSNTKLRTYILYNISKLNAQKGTADELLLTSRCGFDEKAHSSLPPSLLSFIDATFSSERAPTAGKSARTARDLKLYGKTLFGHLFGETENLRVSESLFSRLSKSTTLFASMLSITGRMKLFRPRTGLIFEAVRAFRGYMENDREKVISAFLMEQHSFDEYKQYIERLQQDLASLHGIPDLAEHSAFLVRFEGVKRQIAEEIALMQQSLCSQLHYRARRGLMQILGELDSIEKALGLRFDSQHFDNIRTIMSSVAKLRDLSAVFNLRVVPVHDLYEFIQRLQYKVADYEVEQQEQLRYRMTLLEQQAFRVFEYLSSYQASLQSSLYQQIEQFKLEVEGFTADYCENGPQIPQISPSEASRRLDFCTYKLSNIEQAYLYFNLNEKMFGLHETYYAALFEIKREVELLTRLYSLYNDVVNTLHAYNEYLWNECDFPRMERALQEFQNRCARMPKYLKGLPAYSELKAQLDEFATVFPLLQQLSHKAILERHWNEIAQITGCPAVLTIIEKPEQFRLGCLLQANLGKFRDEIEDLAVAATKESDIEDKLNAVAGAWSEQAFVLVEYKQKGMALLDTKRVSELSLFLEDSLMTLSSLFSNRFNKPFKAHIYKHLTIVSKIDETIKLWLQVQQSWVYLEAVFASGDISRYLPQESRRFVQIERQWLKLMSYVAKNANCIYICFIDDYVSYNLSPLLQDLDETQKCLSGYLAMKRDVFPRFAFLSDSCLLELLGGQSDCNIIQLFAEYLFDSIKCVYFERARSSSIMAIYDKYGETIELLAPVQASGNIEDWLHQLIYQMQRAVRQLAKSVIQDLYVYVTNLPLLVDTYSLYTCLIYLYVLWTQTCENYFRGKGGRLEAKRCQVLNYNVLNQLLALTKHNLNAMDRTKIETLITIYVHYNDIFASLLNSDYVIKSAGDFEWLKQTRAYWDVDMDECVVKIADSVFRYQYEYLGISERLVITPLTDRCYITLAQALSMFLGGAPKGPAGTGKTETCKDFGKSLGYFVVVFNCSSQMDYLNLGKIFKGIAQSGIYGDFDEFNRVELAVMSVAAYQIACILQSMKMKEKSATFTDGSVLKTKASCAFFVTMNPGYAGRVELLENLKVLFRSVSMIVPDKETIMDVKLAASGFANSKELSAKFAILYRLCTEQLSQQRHYDFGLRSILAVLRTCGLQKRYNETMAEALIMLRVLRDMNRAKLVAQDVVLFEFLLYDLFVGITAVDNRYEQLEAYISIYAYALNYSENPEWNKSIIYFYETFTVRHSVMLLGETNAGKTAVISTLSKSLQHIFNQKFQLFRLNPKSITTSQMFGTLNAAGDWTDGIFSALWRKAAKSTAFYMIVLDGPVDAIWIENLNTVMDDNKVLTLANSDRIAMTNTMKLLIEIDSLENASPATVSRAGMIYMNGYAAMGWRPFYDSYCAQWNLKLDILPALEKCHSLTLTTECQLAVQPLYCIKQFVYLFLACALESPYQYASQARHLVFEGFTSARDALLRSYSEAFIVSYKDMPPELVNRLLFFAMMYAFTSLMSHQQKQHFCEKVTGASEFSVFSKPPSTEYLDYFVSSSGEWTKWESYISGYKFDGDYEKALVPIQSNVQLRYLSNKLLQITNMLVVAEAGSGKTKIIRSLYNDCTFKQISMTATVTADILLSNLYSFIVKRLGNTFGPPLNRHGIVFLDDVSTPVYNEWGDQPTNEFVRYLLEQNYFYPPTRPGEVNYIEELQYVAAMYIPGGGRNDIPSRLKSQFFVVMLNIPESFEIDSIYSTFLKYHFAGCFSADVQGMAYKLPKCLRLITFAAKEQILPTPTKFFYRFSLREMTRIVNSLVQLQPGVITAPRELLLCFVNECWREIADRFVEYLDKRYFASIIEKVCRAEFGEFGGKVLQEFDDRIHYCNFMRDAPDSIGENEDLATPNVYEPAQEDALARRIEFFIADFNDKYRRQQIDLVLFDSCIYHLVRLARIFNACGNALLIGIGGAGKKSVTKLICYILYYKVFSITISKSYTLQNFDDDMKRLCTESMHGPIAFRFSDSDLKLELFLDRINNLLMTGEIPALYSKDEKDQIMQEIRPLLKKDCPRRADTNENLWDYFLEKIKTNLRIVLCFSPGQRFFELCNYYPGIVNGCTVDFFDDWSKEALELVAQKSFCFDDDVCKALSAAHYSVYQIIAYYQKVKNRFTATTPKSYLNLLSCFSRLSYAKKSKGEQHIAKLRKGLAILQMAADDVSKMKTELEVQKTALSEAISETDSMMANIYTKSLESRQIQMQVKAVADNCQAYANRIKEEKAIAEAGLAKAMPLLIYAEEALNSIEPSKIYTLRSLRNPPNLIQRILDSVLILLNVKMDKVQVDLYREKLRANVPSWQISYYVMAKDFLSRLYQFDKDSITDEQCELLECYQSQADFLFENSYKASKDVCGLFNWVFAMKQYHYIALEVEPKRKQVRDMEIRYKAAVSELHGVYAELQDKEERLRKLALYLYQMNDRKEALKAQTELTQKRLQTAHSLITGLAGERKRWKEQLYHMESLQSCVLGDSMLLALFLTYAGPYNWEFRQKMIELWARDLRENKIAFYSAICGSLAKELVEDDEIVKWKLLGLPSDDISVQNAAIATQADNYVLFIDPQNQANYWLKKLYHESICVTQQTRNDFRQALENALENGQVLLIEDIEETFDPLLDPLLQRQFYASGTRKEVRVGDSMKLIDPRFRLFFTTRLATPKYVPEMFARCYIIDFAVSFAGLEQQFLSHVVNIEKGELEKQRVQLMEDVNSNLLLAAQLEEQLLTRLSQASDNLLDDADLVAVLNDTKATASDVYVKLKNAQETEAQINEARAEYQEVATRGAIFYFLLTDLAHANNMYYTSLKQYVAIFRHAVVSAEQNSNPRRRIANVLAQLTKTSYNYIVRGLFAIDRYSFTLKLAMEIQLREGIISTQEFYLFLQGGKTLDALPGKPEWMQDKIWLNICSLSRVPRFRGIVAYCQDSEAYRALCEYDGGNFRLPEEYTDASAFERLLLLRCLREDTIVEESQKYVLHVLGNECLSQAGYDLKTVIASEASSTVPICFLLTQNSDPTLLIYYHAAQLHSEVYIVSMGYGQEPIARNALEKCMREGGILQLNNSHLALDFMNELEEVLAALSGDSVADQLLSTTTRSLYANYLDQRGKNEVHQAYQLKKSAFEVHESFRVVLATEASANFPIVLLQRSLKLTNEAPTGVQNNLEKLYNYVYQDFLESVETPRFNQMVYGLSLVHVLATERKKFGPIGWSGSYDFGLHDFNASCQFLQTYFYSLGGTKQSVISWKTIHYMIAEVYYGGEITDDWDRRIMACLVQNFLNPAIFSEEYFANGFRTLKTSNLQAIYAHIGNIKNADQAQSFLLSSSAYLAYRDTLAHSLLRSLNSSQSADYSQHLDVQRLIDQIPEAIVLKQPKSADPLDVFLYQELQRQGKTITLVKQLLDNLGKALQGRAVMSDALQSFYASILLNRLPDKLAQVAFRADNFTSFLRQLAFRQEQYKSMHEQRPNVFQIAGFYNPCGFLTAVKQKIARKNAWPLDKVRLATQIVRRIPSQEDIALDNMLLFYAAYDLKRETLVEIQPTTLWTSLPYVVLSAVPEDLPTQGYYECPVYANAERTARNYIFSMLISTTARPSAWALKGVAVVAASPGSM